jgi:Ca2+-binding RTX toxin-like protein
VSETINGNGTSGVLKVTNNHIAIVLDDDCNSHFTNQNMPRIGGVSRIELANGDNIVDLTSTRYSLGDITIVGGKDADIIWSSSGNDTLIGGLGKNTLYGGAGKDHFVFNVALNDASTIMDFEHGIDHIDLDRAIFTKFTAGQSIDGNIAFGLDKQTANSFIVYDSGVVYYDADGAGGQSPVAVAKLIGAPMLTVADFLIL